MQTDSIDVMAGARARAIAAQPMAVAPIFDPTDVRCAGAAPRLELRVSRGIC